MHFEVSRRLPVNTLVADNSVGYACSASLAKDHPVDIKLHIAHFSVLYI